MYNQGGVHDSVGTEYFSKYSVSIFDLPKLPLFDKSILIKIQKYSIKVFDNWIFNTF